MAIREGSMEGLELDAGMYGGMHVMTHSFWSQKNVFITGCSGFLGSWLANALVEQGGNVVGLVRDWVPKSLLNLRRTIERITVVRGQVENYALLERALNEYEIDTVFHLAAQTIVGTASRGPLSTFETNIRGTWNLLEACRRNPMVKRIAVASSDKAYGEQEELPYREDAPLCGSYPYDVSKSCADMLCQAFWKTYGLPVCVTRCGNFYGGGDLNFNRLVPGTVRSVLHDAQPVIRSSGSPRRDYLYIEDAVDAYLLLAEHIESHGLGGEAFNFGNEQPSSALEIVQLILSLMSREDLQPVILNEAKGEIPDQWLSAEKARRVLGWKPTYGLETGLRRTIAFYRDFFGEGE